VGGLDWLLSLHVLSAIFLIGAFAAFWALVLATRPAAPLLPGPVTAAIARPASILISVGTAGTIVFGVWLAIAHDDYELWEAWILASLALWALATETGRRSGAHLNRAAEGDAPAYRSGSRLLALSSLATLAILLLMIWKPGA
jgi:hypothetical protein